MKSLNCVIIEDNRLDRLLLEDYLAEYDFITVKASFQNPIESLPFIHHNAIDLLFLDVDMPVMSGIQLLQALPDAPPCIFITQHPEYAVEAFDIQAVDYLLKPVRPQRLERAIQRALELLDIKTKATQYDLRFEHDFLMIREGSSLNKVAIGDILYLEALTNYTRIFTAARQYITLDNLKNFLEQLPGEKFLRIHRSYAVAVNRIDGLDGNEIIVARQRLPLGKTYRQSIKRIIQDAC